MTTLARTRAETLFASITTHVDHAIKTPASSPDNTVKLHQSGPNTLHLPSAAHIPPVGQAAPVTKAAPGFADSRFA